MHIHEHSLVNMPDSSERLIYSFGLGGKSLHSWNFSSGHTPRPVSQSMVHQVHMLITVNYITFLCVVIAYCVCMIFS